MKKESTQQVRYVELSVPVMMKEIQRITQVKLVGRCLKNMVSLRIL